MSPMEEISKFNSLHDVLRNASFKAHDERLSHASYRIKEETKRMAEQICGGAGTTLSTFLRVCCETLVAEFNSIDKIL